MFGHNKKGVVDLARVLTGDGHPNHVIVAMAEANTFAVSQLLRQLVDHGFVAAKAVTFGEWCPNASEAYRRAYEAAMAT